MFKAISYSQQHGKDIDLPRQLFFILLMFLFFDTFYPPLLPLASPYRNPTPLSSYDEMAQTWVLVVTRRSGELGKS
jgi:hypothetical protein